MKHPLTALVLIGTTSLTFAQALKTDDHDPSRRWLDRPWEIRYVLFVDEISMAKSAIKVARQANGEPESLRKKKVYLRAEAFFEPNKIIGAPDAKNLSLILVSFERNGRVKEPPELRMLTARRNVMDDLVLIDENASATKPYFLAEWSQGVPGDVTFSPAVCAGLDSSRYDGHWETDTTLGNFGCREWTAQLYRRADEQPYIDVTTYRRDGNYIGGFVGWSRFTDPPKPVIGQHGKTWLCLHECPAGEKPGVIPNIKAWTAKHGYPMPKRPPRQPLYANKNYDFDD